MYVGPDLSSFLSKQFKDAPIILHLLNWSAFLDYVSFFFCGVSCCFVSLFGAQWSMSCFL